MSRTFFGKYLTAIPLTVAITVLMAGCMKENAVSPGSDTGELAAVTITLATPTRAAEPLSPGDMADYNLSTLRVMGYNTSKGTLAFNRLINSFTETDTGTEQVKRTAQVEMLTGNFTIVLIGNEGSDPELSAILSDDDQVNDLSSLEELSFSGAAFAQNKDIPMMGRYENVRVLGDDDMQVGDSPVSGTWAVALDRLGVRLDITVRLTPVQAGQWVSGPQKLNLRHIPSLVGLTEPVDNTGDNEREYTEGVFDQNANTLVFRRIILPELYFADKDNPDKALELVTWLNEAGETEYTAKIGTGEPPARDYTIPRNNHIGIAATLKDTGEIEFDMTVQPWEEALNSQVDINGPYTLYVEETDWRVSAEDGERTLKVESDHPGGWTAVLSTSGSDPDAGKPDWIVAGWDESQKFNPSMEELTVDFNINLRQKREAYLHITAGRYTSVTKITQEIGSFANCYMVEPFSQPILIPIAQANRILNGEDEGASITGLNRVEKDNFTVELVWADTPIGPDGVVEAAEAVEIDNEGYIRVVPGQAGNAVIGIKLKGETDFRWSWHIWVTEPIDKGYDPVTGLTWMDRNLGATANTPLENDNFVEAQWVKTLGLYYQWGRKDAFPGTDGADNNQTYYTPSNTSGTTAHLSISNYTDLPDMVRNPLNFTTNWVSYRGSVEAENDNNSWGGVSGKKTVYDPCPPGWKVPLIQTHGQDSWGSSSDWGSWANSGRLFHRINGIAGLMHYYPATGYRPGNSGSFAGVGTDGWYWSATTGSAGSNPQYASALDVYTGYVRPANNLNRSHGFSVRCVAE